VTPLQKKAHAHTRTRIQVYLYPEFATLQKLVQSDLNPANRHQPNTTRSVLHYERSHQFPQQPFLKHAAPAYQSLLDEC
jgi:hypothetical protein